MIILLTNDDVHSSLRTFSTVADLLQHNLGTAHYNQKKARRVGLEKAGPKMPLIINFASGMIEIFPFFPSLILNLKF